MRTSRLNISYSSFCQGPGNALVPMLWVFINITISIIVHLISYVKNSYSFTYFIMLSSTATESFDKFIFSQRTYS